MAKDLSSQVWHGIPRKEILRFPTIEKRNVSAANFVTFPAGDLYSK